MSKIPKLSDVIRVGSTLRARQDHFNDRCETGTYTTEFEAKVLVVLDTPDNDPPNGYVICEGGSEQAKLHPYFQDACKAAGLDPEQKVTVVMSMDIIDTVLSFCKWIATRKDLLYP